MAAAHRTLVPALQDALKAAGAEDILVVVGGVIPAQDYQDLFDSGVACVFGPGTKIPVAAREVIPAIREKGSEN